MSVQHQLYLERAAKARAIARAATLYNVRDRWLPSEANWTGMAIRSERSEKVRAKLIAEKATEGAALKAALASALPFPIDPARSNKGAECVDDA